jgi:glycine/D-amino acid oxidase-like deaminating enzyme
MATRYGTSPWIAEFPKSRVPSYPRQRGALDVDALIIGGGLAGCATAYAFAAHGVKVALIEAAQIGRGSAGQSAGWLADDPRGRRAARLAFQAWRRAALDFAALLRRLDAKCHLESRAALLVARTPEQASWVARERKARAAAALEAPLLNARAVSAQAAFAGPSAIRLRDGAVVDPYRATLALAAGAAARGAAIFERSSAVRIRFDRRTADVETSAGSVHTRRVVVATGAPTRLFKPLARHFHFHRAYLALTARLPAVVRRAVLPGATVVHDLADPPHLVRWQADDRLLVCGAAVAAPPDRLRDKLLVQKTGQLMYELSTIYPDVSGAAPAYGWDIAYASTADGLPFIGPHRNYPHHLFAFGHSRGGLTGAYLASRLLLRQHLGQISREDQLFGFR